MKITLNYLKKGWDSLRIKTIKNSGTFYVGSEKLLSEKYSHG